MHIHLGAYVWAYIHVEARGQIWASFIESHPPCVLRQCCSLFCRPSSRLASLVSKLASFLDYFLRFILLLFFYTYVCFCVSDCHMCEVPSCERDRSLRAGVKCDCEPTEHDALKGQQSLLTNKPYLSSDAWGLVYGFYISQSALTFAWKHFTN